MRHTYLAQLVGVKLGADLRERIIQQRRAGVGWRTVTRELARESGINMSHESVRQWFADEPELVERPKTAASP